MSSVVALTGCGQRSASAPGGTTVTSPTTTTSTGSATGTRTATGSGELAAVATVMDSGKGPELCLGGVADSYPPQCGGPPVVGWDWSKAPPSERAGGSRWGTYAVVGTFDGNRFTLTRPATTPEAFTGTRPAKLVDPDLTTPCPPPSGGWRVLDAAKSTQENLDATLEAAPRISGYAGAWLDQSRNTADPTTQPELMNDPTKLVLVVATAGDIATTEQALRRTWGGALCVTAARHSEAELRKAQDAVAADAELRRRLLMSGIDATVNALLVEVTHDDGTLQARMDAAYGRGMVRVSSALFPYVPR